MHLLLHLFAILPEQIFGCELLIVGNLKKPLIFIILVHMCLKVVFGYECLLYEAHEL
jgi:uncharacterized membrane protein YhdT